MTCSGRPRWQVPAALALLMLTAALIFSCGCTQQATPLQVKNTTVQTPVATDTLVPSTVVQEGKKMVTFTERDNETTAEIASGTRFAIQLKENPTTGFSWNATTTPGLTILSSDYQVDEHQEGMVGVGGTRTWVLRASGTGNQTFTGIYTQPWMNGTKYDKRYSLTIVPTS